jgi:hypothetical protein
MKVDSPLFYLRQTRRSQLLLIRICKQHIERNAKQQDISVFNSVVGEESQDRMCVFVIGIYCII